MILFYLKSSFRICIAVLFIFALDGLLINYIKYLFSHFQFFEDCCSRRKKKLQQMSMKKIKKNVSLFLVDFFKKSNDFSSVTHSEISAIELQYLILQIHICLSHSIILDQLQSIRKTNNCILPSVTNSFVPFLKVGFNFFSLLNAIINNWSALQ